MGPVAGPAQLFTADTADGEYCHGVCAGYCLLISGRAGIENPRLERSGAAVYLVFSRHAAAGAAVSVLLRPAAIDALISINGVTAAVLGLTLHFSAYMAESIRAAIVGIDRSQTEAALSIGMTQSQLMRRIILPQATRVATPTLMNYFIDMIKATSLAFTLGVTELMGATQKEASGSFLYLEAFLLVAIIYWVVVEALSWGQRRLETYLNKAYQR